MGFFFAKLLSLTSISKEKSGRQAVTITAIAPYKFNNSRAFGTKQWVREDDFFCCFS